MHSNPAYHHLDPSQDIPMFYRKDEQRTEPEQLRKIPRLAEEQLDLTSNKCYHHMYLSLFPKEETRPKTCSRSQDHKNFIVTESDLCPSYRPLKYDTAVNASIFFNRLGITYPAQSDHTKDNINHPRQEIPIFSQSRHSIPAENHPINVDVIRSRNSIYLTPNNEKDIDKLYETALCSNHDNVTDSSFPIPLLVYLHPQKTICENNSHDMHQMINESSATAFNHTHINSNEMSLSKFDQSSDLSSNIDTTTNEISNTPCNNNPRHIYKTLSDTYRVQVGRGNRHDRNRKFSRNCSLECDAYWLCEIALIMIDNPHNMENVIRIGNFQIMLKKGLMSSLEDYKQKLMEQSHELKVRGFIREEECRLFHSCFRNIISYETLLNPNYTFSNGMSSYRNKNIEEIKTRRRSAPRLLTTMTPATPSVKASKSSQSSSSSKIHTKTKSDNNDPKVSELDDTSSGPHDKISGIIEDKDDSPPSYLF
mmetsp:Transcript_5584/g.5772  ORF Transcript_5584/g.5772 Transcript_5584/m.5772 type:complete len:479 (+) Transcript_5584:47-1483(+)